MIDKTNEASEYDVTATATATATATPTPTANTTDGGLLDINVNFVKI